MSFGIEIAKRNLAVIIGIIAMVVLLVSFLAPAMTANAATGDAIASNVATDIANVRYVETVAQNLGEPVVTDLTQHLPGGIKFTPTAGDTDTVLSGASGYVIVTRDQAGEVFVSTSSATKTLGIVTKPVTAAQLGNLPVNSAAVLKTVDPSTITISTPTKSTPSTSSLYVKVIDEKLASAANWLENLLGVTVTTKN